ncbi:hypothetical protein D3C78_1799690 [compost metagenome]
MGSIGSCSQVGPPIMKMMTTAQAMSSFIMVLLGMCSRMEDTVLTLLGSSPAIDKTAPTGPSPRANGSAAVSIP